MLNEDDIHVQSKMQLNTYVKLLQSAENSKQLTPAEYRIVDVKKDTALVLNNCWYSLYLLKVETAINPS